MGPADNSQEPAPSGTVPQSGSVSASDPATAPTLAPRPIDSAGPGPGGRVRYFGDYEILEEIARGGMGVVYKARQISLNRPVALKMILAGALATPESRQRFRMEAEAAANLQHPNIVAIHEVGEHEGQQYYSMDFVEGKNLAQLAGGRPLPAKHAATYVKTIAEAVHFAHQRGTLHRDLKPQNVLIDAGDRPRITDFGLAKRVEVDRGLTRTGDVLGSPSYMPPEQADMRPSEIGPQSDVYSLGAILYELLTGRPPFRGATTWETLSQVVQTPPVPPRKLNPEVPRDLETICQKCLEKRPERRYHSARELAEDLERFVSLEPIHARRVNPARRMWLWLLRHPWIITAIVSTFVVALLLLACGLWAEIRFLVWQRAHPDYVRAPGPWSSRLRVLRSFDFMFFNVGVLALIYFWHRRLAGLKRSLDPQALAHPGTALETLAYGVVGGVGTLAAIAWGVTLTEAYIWEGSGSIMDLLKIPALSWISTPLLVTAARDAARTNRTPESVTDAKSAGHPWGLWPTLGFSLAVLFSWLAATAFVAMLYPPSAEVPRLESGQETLAFASPEDGTFLAVSALFLGVLSALVCLFCAALKRGISLRSYFALRVVPVRQLAYWIAVALVIAATSDMLGAFWGRPIVPDSMLRAYRSVIFEPLLWIAIVIGTLSQEVFFRGFLFAGIRQSRLGDFGAVAVIAAAAAIQSQNGLYGISTAFVLGLALGYARIRTDSLVVPLFMSGVTAALAMLEAAIFVHVLR